ncbi:putative ABC transport system ATP-binding protein [Methylobacterium sp. BE186]|uniref:ABC transporter transmembrane domain-containing protein n=1 Tax=Methylobacterium sp. BE186 TaxID=2817715 RepID=UPI00285DBE29|nr:ABC transporter transmembrane domain-containing protein [Methylobacterium sp. BE186]MDR7039604.1 putative ABC transport system ATP-binding protein [Methylobacterium sp. BE186]
MRDLQPTLFQYIWAHSKRDQLAICAVVFVSLPFYFASLDLPRRIVNDAITGKAFGGGRRTAPFLDLTIHWPLWAGGGATTLFEGFQLERMELLIGLSALFLALVLINGAFKFWINLSKGVLGERMLRRLRFQLFALMLRFTPEAQREVKASETATIIRDEVEPIGAFIGDAIISPVFLGTQAATALTFILLQNVWLGLVAAAIVAVQFIVIPRLRRTILRLSRERQLRSRELAGHVGEVLEGLDAVTVNDAGRWERAEFGGRLHRLYSLRLRIYRRKFAIKYLNNLLAQVTPFLFYAVGGMFALHGQLDIGQLVAVLAAYRDLPPPLKELIDWDQQRLDVEVKYETVAAHFAAHRLRRAEAEEAEGAAVPAARTLEWEGVALRSPHDGELVAIADATVPLPARVGFVVEDGELAHVLARALVGLDSPQSGAIRLGGHDLVGLPQSVRSRLIGYAGRSPNLFPGSIRDNVVYGLHRIPTGPVPTDADRQAEALRTGNPVETIEQNWIDYARLGVSGAEGLDRRILALLAGLGMERDLYRFGLSTICRDMPDPTIGTRLIAARRHLQALLDGAKRGGLVVPFAADRYNDEATVAENLLFGVPREPGLMDRLAAEPAFVEALGRAGLGDGLVGMGVAIARNLVEIFRDLPQGHTLFRRFSLITPDALPDYVRQLARIDADGGLEPEDRAAFLALTLRYVETRQRFGLLDSALQVRIVRARGLVQAALGGIDGNGIEPYDPDRINPRISILENLLFGRISTRRMHAEADMREHVLAAVRRFDLEEWIERRGLDVDVGNRGQLLTDDQRARIEIARAALTLPPILVVEDSGVLDRALIGFLAASDWSGRETSLVLFTASAALAAGFDPCITVGRTGARRATAGSGEPGDPVARTAPDGRGPRLRADLGKERGLSRGLPPRGRRS